MKIAIISDIHGNIHALEAVLADIDRQCVDQVVVNGDLVNRGPNNLAVMRRLIGQGFAITLGNHDDLVVKWEKHSPDLPEKWFSDPFWDATAHTVQQLLDADFIDALRHLPMTHSISVPGAPAVLIAHGSPRHYREGYGNLMTEQTAREINTVFPAKVYVGSHTHVTLEKRFGDLVFWNTGAIGAPFNLDPRAQYLILELVDNGWQGRFQAVEYDRVKAMAAFAETGYLEKGGLSAHIFRDELFYARVLFDPYWRWMNQHNQPGTWETWEVFKSQHPDRFL